MASVFGDRWDEKPISKLLLDMASWRSDAGGFTYVVPVSRFTLFYLAMLAISKEDYA